MEWLIIQVGSDINKKDGDEKIPREYLQTQGLKNQFDLLDEKHKRVIVEKKSLIENEPSIRGIGQHLFLR